MMFLDFEISLITFLAISALQLVFGAAIGWFMHVIRVTSRPVVEVESAEPNKVDEVLNRLYDLVGSVGDNVGRHAHEVQSIGQELAQAEGKSDSEIQKALFTAMAQIAEANARLKGELNTAEKKLQEQAGEIESQTAAARTDALTSISNRRAFNDRLAAYIAQFERTHSPVSLILFDVDHFKKFNDTHGHLAGDKVLQGVAAAMEGAIRGEDTAARYGGEEFAVLVPDIDAQGTAETVRRAIEACTFECEGVTLKVTASGGMAHLVRGDSAATLIQRADDALYKSKKAGRNQTHWNDGEQCIPLTASALSPSKFKAKLPETQVAPVAESPAPAAAEAAAEPAVEAAEAVANSPAESFEQQSAEQDGLVNQIKGILEHNDESNGPMSLILVDVDALKRLNETHGTTTGDVVLRAVMQFLTAGLREIDTITRLNGDCFALTLRRADLDYAIQVAERVRNAIGLCKLRVGDNQIHFTISSGLAEAGADDDAEVLYLRSNLALQAAKAAGRNCTFYHDGIRCEPVTEVGQEAQTASA